MEPELQAVLNTNREHDIQDEFKNGRSAEVNYFVGDGGL
jgi:hypothetical protein